jgi:hypothetical protein
MKGHPDFHSGVLRLANCHMSAYSAAEPGKARDETRPIFCFARPCTVCIAADTRPLAEYKQTAASLPRNLNKLETCSLPQALDVERYPSKITPLARSIGTMSFGGCMPLAIHFSQRSFA